MIYEYRCKFCERSYDVVKPLSQIDVEELCPLCQSEMTRVFAFKGKISLGTFKPGRYDAFGKTFTRKSQLDDELKRIKHETGKELVEVGNDTGGFKKPKDEGPDMKAAVSELSQLMRGK